jgi:predicted polyphosphate/ATP-dependent NAD kinase
MGGSVGLKGTDGRLLLEAIKRGAKPVAPSRARRFLRKLLEYGRFEDVRVVSANGVMGCLYLEEIGLNPSTYECLDIPRSSETSRDDTLEVLRELLRRGVELLVFVGGDGTARDVLEVCGTSVPILGVPSGVKVYSSVFAVSPEAAAELVVDFCRGLASVELSEVLDIDEEALQRDVMLVELRGRAITPSSHNLRVQTKELYSGDDLEGIAMHFLDYVYRPGVLYLLGPGGTVKYIAEKLGVGKTLLGFDAVVDGKLVGRDLTSEDIKSLLKRYAEVYVVLSVVGGQGYLIGRGNQQLTPEVLKTLGRDRLIVVSPRNKLLKLRYLLIDSGDPEVDRQLAGYYRVIVGYGEEYIMKALSASNTAQLRGLEKEYPTNGLPATNSGGSTPTRAFHH